MAKIVTQNREVLYVQPSGPHTGLEPLSVQEHGMDDAADNTVPQRAAIFGRDGFARPQVKLEYDQPPSGLVQFNITFDKKARLDFLDKQRNENATYSLWKFFIPFGRIDNYVNWALKGRLDFFAGCKVTQPTHGGGPSKDYSGTPVVQTFQNSARRIMTLNPPALTSLTTTEVNDLNCIDVIPDLDPNHEIPGYPGADKIIIIGCDAVGAGTANLLYSIDGGSTFTAFSPDPFAADEHIGGVQVRFMTPTKYRIIVQRLTADVGNPNEIAFTDVTVGNETASLTWTYTNLGSTNNQAGEKLAWPLFNRLYTAAAGDIYRSTNQGESLTLVYTGANTINGVTKDYDDNVWVVATANTILKESADKRDTFDALVGPSGGGAFTAIAVARDGIVYAGNGTSIFKSNNGALNTAGWTNQKNFGANHVVKKIQCIDGESQLLRLLVTDTVGNDGDVWYSLDGGNTWTEVDNLTNSGYNDAYFSDLSDLNLAFIVGEDNGTTGVIHKLTVA